MYLLGQICGIVSTIITILQPQFRRKVQILFCGILINGLNALNFILIGQTGSAVYLCPIGMLQSAVAIWHERKNTKVAFWESILFVCLYLGFGLLSMMASDGFAWKISWNMVLELLPIAGALMFMLSVFAKGEQKTRVFLLLNGTAWVIYTAVIGATAFFSCAAAMISSLIALWKYGRAKKAEKSVSA